MIPSRSRTTKSIKKEGAPAGAFQWQKGNVASSRRPRVERREAAFFRSAFLPFKGKNSPAREVESEAAATGKPRPPHSSGGGTNARQAPPLSCSKQRRSTPAQPPLPFGTGTRFPLAPPPASLFRKGGGRA